MQIMGCRAHKNSKNLSDTLSCGTKPMRLHSISELIVIYMVAFIAAFWLWRLVFILYLSEMFINQQSYEKTLFVSACITASTCTAVIIRKELVYLWQRL